MRIPVILLAAVLAFPAGAAAMPFSYYREHKAWCDANIGKDTWAKEQCVNRAWCGTHWNDDRITRITCDPFRSRADLHQPAATVSVAGLDAGRDLTAVETQSAYFGSDPPPVCGIITDLPDRHPAIKPDPDLLPLGMKTARLALAAQLCLAWFPATVVKIGIGANGKAMMSMRWSVNGTGARRVETIHLSGYETDHLLAALNRSDFWRLPDQPRHMGMSDGEGASVEISMPGRRKIAVDAIGPEDGVDLTVLVNEISRIIARHWKDVPA